MDNLEKIFTYTSFNYLTIPLVAHVGWGNDRLKVYGTAGGYYAMPVHGRVSELKYLDKELVSEVRQDADFDNEYSKTDLGLRFGAGLEVYVSKNKKHGVFL
jgi:opacity protein-like surface antigen